MRFKVGDTVHYPVQEWLNCPLKIIAISIDGTRFDVRHPEGGISTCLWANHFEPLSPLHQIVFGRLNENAKE